MAGDIYELLEKGVDEWRSFGSNSGSLSNAPRFSARQRQRARAQARPMSPFWAGLVGRMADTEE
ncbi:hypothetical protein E2562_001767 [Oryza meyeriana var. granulata]|uniref:Uncharacterized protein n=1 Tax=Oryza meyeriana var. granulata TaxID=110450 RepID=A0A6G1CDI3_9ORYZ|nr:hypothetical protein E2562_001767 [Oryza meyeriana var. granulata]